MVLQHLFLVMYRVSGAFIYVGVCVKVGCCGESTCLSQRASDSACSWCRGFSYMFVGPESHIIDTALVLLVVSWILLSLLALSRL